MNNLKDKFPEIASGLVDKTQPDWFGWKSSDIDKRFVPKTIWKRFDNGESRFYWSETDEMAIDAIPKINVAMGITSALQVAFPEPFGIKKWRDDNPNWKEDLKNSADYGTLFHMAAEEFMKTRSVPRNYVSYAQERWGMGVKFKKDILAFVKFCKDYNLKPLLIESILGSEPYEHRSIDGTVKNGTAICTAIDLFCKMDFPEKRKVEVPTGEFYKIGEKKGQEKTKTVTETHMVEGLAIVDFKSNYFDKESKDFYEAHKRQLMFGKKMVCKHFGIDPSEVRTYNFSPNAWRKEPTYTLTEQVTSTNKVGFTDEYVLMNKLRGAFVNGDLEPSGSIYSIPDEIDENTEYMALSYEEFIQMEVFGATKDQIFRIREATEKEETEK